MIGRRKFGKFEKAWESRGASGKIAQMIKSLVMTLRGHEEILHAEAHPKTSQYAPCATVGGARSTRSTAEGVYQS